MPVGGIHKRGDFWNGVIEKVHIRLSRWKGRCLTMAGRVCLINSVLSSIPLFFMSLFKLPSGVAGKLIRLQRSFLWGWGAEGRKMAWASWSHVCIPHKFGGLGVIDVRLFNLALLGKWIWRLGSTERDLWKEVLTSKYGGWRSLGEEGKGRRCSLWWKDLKEVWFSEGWGRSFADGFKWSIGEGKDILFWEDRWLNGESLKSSFPRFFSISSSKNAKVSELGYWSNGDWVWQLSWRRSFFEWEKSLAEQLRQLLLEARVVSGEVDGWIWKGGVSQSFSVNSAYNLVRKDKETMFSPIFCKLWKSKAIPSATLMTWRLLENKLATRVNLSRRWVLVDSSLCGLCGLVEESCCHLFFDCSFARRVWGLCHRWVGALVASQIQPKCNFDHFRLSCASETVNNVRTTIWVGVVSELWKHRNSIIFNRGVGDASEVFSLVQVKVWLWVSVNCRSASFSFSGWCLEPLVCMRLIT